jgi:hypothetical protein
LKKKKVAGTLKIKIEDNGIEVDSTNDAENMTA